MQSPPLTIEDPSDSWFDPSLLKGFVTDPIRKWARETPEKLAIDSHELKLTYRELEARTNQISHSLQRKGVETGDRVAFVLPRGPKAILLLVAILKVGAAYVPLDSESPKTRILECLEDAQPKVVVTEQPSNDEHLSLDELLELSTREPETPIQPAIVGADLAYIIFTSGTTGRPKGVPIRHWSLQNFVKGDQLTCICVQPEDRVFQGFSPSSDGHHEEVWPTFLAGATLVVATTKEVHSGLDLLTFLNDFKVTIISCAPTLLSMVEGEVPSLRRILFGAESCPPAMVSRWARPGRTIINTYGPTEATVGATFGICEPNQPITIGLPLPNYQCLIVDENLNEVEEGELAIAGVGVATGYYRRDDLSSTRFLKNPHSSTGHHNETLYRTGDLVRRDESGRIIWLGRIDTQIKIRGHRIELSEIESVLVASPAVKTAVVVARKIDDRDIRLAALLVLREDIGFEVAEFISHLHSKLPGYMIPQSFEEVTKLPTLPSGKIDRRSCDQLRGAPFRFEREILPPTTPTEELIISIWSDLFPETEISATDDFFRELGGYSLLASRFISTLRNDHGFIHASVLDIYENPTLRGFAAVLEQQQRPAREEVHFNKVSDKLYNRAKYIQAGAILFMYGMQGFFWLGPIIAAIYFSNKGLNETGSVLLGLGLYAVSLPVLLIITIAARWIVGGKLKPGRYPLWGPVFLRWWFVERMLVNAPVVFITGTPFASLYLRLLGAKIGKNVLLDSLEFDCPGLISIGDNTIVEDVAWLRAAEIAHGELILREVVIGEGCFIGLRSGVAGGGVMEKGAALRDVTYVGPGVTVPEGEEWEGSPARPAAERRIPPYDPNAQAPRRTQTLFGMSQGIGVLFLTVLESLPFVITAYVLYNNSEGFVAYLWEPLYAIAMVLFACIQTALIKWLVMGRLKAGTYKLNGVYSYRMWFADKHLDLLSRVTVAIYDSLLAGPWCRILGMKVGDRCEIAFPRGMPYDLVDMGEESFLASDCSVGLPVKRNNEITLRPTRFGRKTFLGNDSVIPQGSETPPDFLLGVLSVCPPKEVLESAPDQAWLGSPPFKMPSRQVSGQFDVRKTYRPGRKQYLHRLMHELLRIVLPSFGFLLIASILIEGFNEIWNQTSFELALITLPFLYLFGAFVALLLCWVSKTLLVGKYEPRIEPLWSPFVWRSETHFVTLHDFAFPIMANPLVGTSYMNAVLRFLGARVGRRAFIQSTYFTETDLIWLGEDVAINANVPLQGHLFEDRVLKVGPIKVGDRASVGKHSIVLCDSELRNDAHVGDLSLVMKGETIPSHTFWVGSPAQSSEEVR